MTYDVIVVGAGVNGLTTAALLAKAGRKVLVVEQRAAAGGLCTTEEFAPGYRANTCIDDAGWLPAALAKELSLDGYAPFYAASSITIPIDGAAPLVISPDVRATADALRVVSPRDAAKWPDFCAFVHRLSGFMEALYGTRAPAIESNAPGDLLSLMSLGRKLRGLGKRGMIDVIRTIPMPIADLFDEWFEHDALKGALSTLGVLNVQHGPQSGGTALVFLHNHVGLPLGHIGARRVSRGGVGTLPAALASALTRAGGVVRTGAGVARIVVRDDRVTGVVLASGEEIAASIVVSSADPRRTFTTMLDAGDFDPELLHTVDCVRMRGPQARVHLALSELPRFISGETPWREPAYRGAVTIAPTMSYVERAYDAAKHGGVADAPWIRAIIPTLDDIALAPSGQHVMSVQVQSVAYALRGGWTTEAATRLGDTVVEMLDAVAPGLRDSIVHREVLTPPDVEERFGATEGSLLHGELTLDQFLFARPVASIGRYAAPIGGLWLCGSGTHPGAGTAGASGRLAAREIMR
jgi:phytoene dehydrogenase-like protein